MPYRPTPVDLSFAESMMVLINEGGLMAFPGERGELQLQYLVSHARRTLTLMNPKRLRSPHAQTVHERTREVWKRLDYRVQEFTPEMIHTIIVAEGTAVVEMSHLISTSFNPRARYHALCADCGNKFETSLGTEFPTCPYCGSRESCGKVA